MTHTTSFTPLPVADGIRSRMVHGINGLDMHILEAGFEQAGRPLLLLLHGFPELAFSWRKVMVPLAEAGFHVVAPDQRGYGLTTGWDANYDGDLRSFRMLNIVRDAIGLVHALGYRSVASVIGHDFGSPAAAWAALVRPDIFKTVVLMSAPFGGPPPLPFDTDKRPPAAPPGRTIHDELLTLDPPRTHYHQYYSTREADGDMRLCPQGIHAFLRAYYHHKSADWAANRPYRLTGWTADQLALLPTYYVMRADQNMAETVADEMPAAAAIAACRWLPDADLAIYAEAFARTTFQGGLQWYRARTVGWLDAELETFSGRTIDVPAFFIAGAADWGVYQRPGDLEAMEGRVCSLYQGTHLVAGAGHWVQQEQPQAVTGHILGFLARNRATTAA